MVSFDATSQQYLASLNQALPISVLPKIRTFAMYQKLGYEGSLSETGSAFHSLQDFVTQMSTYSATNSILTAAWATISPSIQIPGAVTLKSPQNPSIEAQLVRDPNLGVVGNLFSSIQNFSQVFSINPSQVSSPGSISSQASNVLG